VDIAHSRRRRARRRWLPRLLASAGIAGSVREREQPRPDGRARARPAGADPPVVQPNRVAVTRVHGHVRYLAHAVTEAVGDAGSGLPLRPREDGAQAAPTVGPTRLRRDTAAGVQLQGRPTHGERQRIGGGIVDGRLGGIGASIRHRAVVGALVTAGREHGHALGHGLGQQIMHEREVGRLVGLLRRLALAPTDAEDLRLVVVDDARVNVVGSCLIGRGRRGGAVVDQDARAGRHGPRQFDVQTGLELADETVRAGRPTVDGNADWGGAGYAEGGVVGGDIGGVVGGKLVQSDGLSGPGDGYSGDPAAGVRDSRGVGRRDVVGRPDVVGREQARGRGGEGRSAQTPGLDDYAPACQSRAKTLCGSCERLGALVDVGEWTIWRDIVAQSDNRTDQWRQLGRQARRGRVGVVRSTVASLIARQGYAEGGRRLASRSRDIKEQVIGVRAQDTQPIGR